MSFRLGFVLQREILLNSRGCSEVFWLCYAQFLFVYWGKYVNIYNRRDTEYGMRRAKFSFVSRAMNSGERIHTCVLVVPCHLGRAICLSECCGTTWVALPQLRAGLALHFTALCAICYKMLYFVALQC